MFKLVITVSLKKELPLEWLKERGLQVLSSQAISSGALKSFDHKNHKDPLIVLTGVGPQRARIAAELIVRHLKPLFVLNIGSCGLTNRALPLGVWLRPRWVSSAHSDRTLLLDPRIPIPLKKKPVDIRLHEVEKPFSGRLSGIDAVDMECYSQAEVFRKHGVAFHALKFGTDYADEHRDTQYLSSLPLLQEAVKGLLSFVEERVSPERISVVIPVFNRASTIKRAIDSVIEQTSRPSEIIVVDDGSTDGTGDVLKAYDGRIRAIGLSENRGPSVARNIGVMESSGDWIAFLDSDDYWQRRKLEQELEYLKGYPFFEILQSEEIWIRKGKRVNPCKHHKKPEGWAWEPSLKRCLISPSGVLIKRELFLRYGMFREDFPVCEDYDLWLKITRNHPVGLVPEFGVVKFGGHPDQLSRRFRAMDRFRVQSLLEQYEQESYPEFREKLREEIEVKLKVLYRGYKKRNRKEDIIWCEHVLKVIGYEDKEIETFRDTLQG